KLMLPLTIRVLAEISAEVAWAGADLLAQPGRTQELLVRVAQLDLRQHQTGVGAGKHVDFPDMVAVPEPVAPLLDRRRAATLRRHARRSPAPGRPPWRGVAASRSAAAGTARPAGRWPRPGGWDARTRGARCPQRQPWP